MIDIDLVVKTIKEMLPQNQFIALHEPEFSGNEWSYVKECLDSGWVSSVGKYVDSFEQRLAEFTGAKRAVVVVNGTAALQIALKIVGVERNDEVIMPTLTFIATANTAAYIGAIPHFVDSEERTLGMDPIKLGDYLKEIAEVKSGECFNKKTKRRIKAVVPMHTFGHPVDLDPLIDVCHTYSLELVEDAAESLGSYYKGKHTGTFGRASSLSFNGNKIMTTGGGGAILTNEDRLADWAKHLTTTAKKPHRWEYVHDEIGYNFRMPNINAALGCAQLESVPGYLDHKRLLAEQYIKAFKNVSGVKMKEEERFTKSNYWLNTLVLDKQHAADRDQLLIRLNEEGIMARPIWQPMHRMPMYEESPKMDVSVSEELFERVINLPSSAHLGGQYA